MLPKNNPSLSEGCRKNICWRYKEKINQGLVNAIAIATGSPLPRWCRFSHND